MSDSSPALTRVAVIGHSYAARIAAHLDKTVPYSCQEEIRRYTITSFGVPGARLNTLRVREMGRVSVLQTLLIVGNDVRWDSVARGIASQISGLVRLIV